MKGFAMVRTGEQMRVDERGPGAFDQLVELEQESVRIFLNQPLFVPGLFQVPGYATEMIGRIRGLKSGDSELEDRVKARMQRAEAFHQRLRGNEPPQVWAAIDEAVLRRTTGGPAVMRDQLDHLVRMSGFSTVHIGIVPLSHGAHPGLAGSFEVHALAGGETSVFFEGASGDAMVGSDQALIQRCRETVESMVASAVSGGEARALLEAIRGTL